MKYKLTAIVLALTIVLIGCTNNKVNEQSTLKGKIEDIKQLVHDYSIGNIDAPSASITGTELIVTDESGTETVYDLPKDEFFVSIAPFKTETHPCTFHSLTGCQGEIVEEEFYVYIEDMEGNAIVDQKMMSLENGFIDLWLPRDKVFYVKISQGDMVTESELSTFAEDATCITTMQLR